MVEFIGAKRMMKRDKMIGVTTDCAFYGMGLLCMLFIMSRGHCLQLGEEWNRLEGGFVETML
jgi:hypothetical protein